MILHKHDNVSVGKYPRPDVTGYLGWMSIGDQHFFVRDDRGVSRFDEQTDEVTRVSAAEARAEAVGAGVAQFFDQI